MPFLFSSENSGRWRDPQASNVMRRGLGRRLVNLLPPAQRTKTLTNGVVGRTWVVGREFGSHVHHEIAFIKKKRVSSCREPEKYSWILRNWNRVSVSRGDPYIYPVRSRWGESVVPGRVFRLDRRSVNLLPLARRTKTSTPLEPQSSRFGDKLIEIYLAG